MKIQLTLLVLTLFTLTCLAQDHGSDNSKSINDRWISENTFEIKLDSVSEILKMDFSKVGDLIGNARIVLLGEQDHGDGASFMVKTSLIKFLHEEKGFNVVAFESGFYELNNIWETKLDTDKKIENAKANMYSIWSKSKQTQPLFKYIKDENEKGRSLIITGFDSRHASTYSKEQYLIQFDSVVRSNNLAILKESDYLAFKTILSGLISEEYNHQPKNTDKDLFFASIEKMLLQFDQSGPSINQFWLQELNSLRGNAKSVWADKSKIRESISQRDRQMADNLLWLIQHKYKDEKIIVWAANYHIAKSDNYIPKQKYYNHEDKVLMGEILNPVLGDKMFNIGFTSSSGQYTDMTYQKTIRDIKVSPSSLESLLSRTKYEYGFVNFKSNRQWTIIPFNMSAFSHFELKGNWTHVFDGVFYIREMTPSEF